MWSLSHRTIRKFLYSFIVVQVVTDLHSLAQSSLLKSLYLFAYLSIYSLVFVSSRCTSPLYYRTIGFRRSLGAFVWSVEEKSDIQEFFVGMELEGWRDNFFQGDCSCHSGGAMSPGASDCGEVRQELVNYTLCPQCVRFFVTPGTVACQALLSLGFLQTRILEWVAMPSSWGSSWPKKWACVFTSPALVGGFFTTSANWEVNCGCGANLGCYLFL